MFRRIQIAPAVSSAMCAGGHRHDRAGAAAGAGRARRSRGDAIRWRPSKPHFPPRRRTSSSCSWRAGRARSICSIPSPSCRSGTASRCRASMTKDLRLAFTKPTAAVLASPRKFKPYGQMRHGVLRLHSAHRVVRRRYLPGALDVHATRSIIIPGQLLLFRRQHAGRPSDDGRLGRCTGSAANRRTCPASWC